MDDSEESLPIYYIGHHDAGRADAITDSVLQRAHNVGYDMLTTSITTPHFHSNVLSILSSHLSQTSSGDADKNVPGHGTVAPVIPPLTPEDTNLYPDKTTSHLIATTSSWIDLCSPDPMLANVSRQVLNLEVAYASFCGIGNVIIRGPSIESSCVSQYARSIKEALQLGPCLAISIWLPASPSSTSEGDRGSMGSLQHFARPEYAEIDEDGNFSTNKMFSWEIWNLVRSVCNYSMRLSVALSISDSSSIPPEVADRWFCEPLRLLLISAECFVKNKGGFPVLSKANQSLLHRYAVLKATPWIVLYDVGPLPEVDSLRNSSLGVGETFNADDEHDEHDDDATITSPTPAEAADPDRETQREMEPRDSISHLRYLRFLLRNQPPRSTMERFGSGYQDYLQAPLQPLADNLESLTYEVFEKDPVKYDQYEKAIAQALAEWAPRGKKGSGPDSKVVVAVAGAGRGPLVNRALHASDSTGVPIELWAVEKNPNAYVLLQRHNLTTWAGAVSIVKSDMRAWKGPFRNSNDPNSKTEYGHVDILISELLGSFADNELSPECLDGVQHVLHPSQGISIPASYTAHLVPVSAPKLHADISGRLSSDPSAAEISYVVMLHAIEFLAYSHRTRDDARPLIKQTWEFSHPTSQKILSQAQRRRGAGTSGGGGGQMAGGDGANEHNSRFSRLRFPCDAGGVCHGLAGYFEAVLYGNVELSTRPDRMHTKSKDMISWFPIYFPLKTPLYFAPGSTLDVSIWRQTDDRKVWYEWLVEAFTLSHDKIRVKTGFTELHSSRKNGSLM